jgi:thiol-disulfide isomerase/thioredoxin
MTCTLKRPVHVVAAQSQKLETFDLPASNLGLIQGLPAPEITDVVGWKNGPAPKLAELRSKCVILDFFGYWCGPCVQEMPEVMALYEKYRDQGLVVIGVHTDLGEDEEEPVDTAEELDKRLAEARENRWQGRDLPFPVALIKCVRTRYRDDLPGFDEAARSATAAKYGVMGYPTQILIDRKGNVVGRFNLDEEGIKLLEKTLLDK